MTPRQLIQERHGSAVLNDAITQERQLAYLTESQIQSDYLTPEYLRKWAERQFETSDYFLNYVKSVFKADNFLTFFKYLRYPLPSSKIVNSKIIPDLKRVFHADDSCFDYSVTNVDKSDYLTDLDPEGFNKSVFDAMMGRHNAIFLTDLSPTEENTPVRTIVPIENVVSIEHTGDTINKIAFSAQLPVLKGEETEFVKGYYYVDDERYAFLDSDLNLVEGKESMHDLGHCPAHFIAARQFADKVILRESIYSYVRGDMEEYNFLKTLQKMTEPNGAIPITTYLKTKTNKDKTKDFQTDSLEAGGSEAMASQRAGVVGNTVKKGVGITETGTTIGIPAPKKEDGSLDMEAIKSFVTFHYMPVESLKYLNERISEIERSIVVNLIGDATESKEDAKNELQIRKAIIVLENTLRMLSADFSRIRNLADTDWLGLRYGIERVEEVTTFYGSDFFLETEGELLESFNASPNPIEGKNILNRLTESRYRNNPEKLERQFILNNLMPFISDKDFDKAITRGLDDQTFVYQNRFVYWIQQFEAVSGDIVVFFNDLGEINNAIKFTVINNLILELINGNIKSKSLRRPKVVV